jgi:hypothetical protein
MPGSRRFDPDAFVRSPADAPSGAVARPSAGAMARLTEALLDHLPDDRRRTASWPFDDPQRFDWHYVPRQREGVALGDMPPAARDAVHALLRHALSDAGYRKACEIMALEEPLGLIERHRGPRRDPLNYSVTVFGMPGRPPWGWRIEGHHLSLNVTVATEALITVTPAFWGSNPARVPEGYPMAGHRVLGRETELCYALIRGLDETLRARAIIGAHSLGDIVTGPGRETALHTPDGLPLGTMPEGSRALAMELLAIFARNLRADLAEQELARVRAADPARLHFAWAGPLDDGHANYWRLHGPVTLVEYDNTQNDANHIHTVWHDPDRDFGRDPLRAHYQGGDHQHR